eukprot:4553152-Prymnesium_polylepis.1
MAEPAAGVTAKRPHLTVGHQHEADTRPCSHARRARRHAVDALRGPHVARLAVPQRTGPPRPRASFVSHGETLIAARRHRAHTQSAKAADA